MNSRLIVETALASDPTITPEQKERILAGYESPEKKQPRMLTRIQVAERLQVHPGSVKRFDQRGILTPVRITPRVVRYCENEVDALLKNRG
ncbi:helix-turn-helix transcriptional regulator [Tichowtungia aerotolerans]|uniref:Helix-turn-helix domain-containing protein n=1 Tax=Tichowtungia aerotolerans TaxID=2697043 RepID=A0A6P1M410_9BACT|nr:hypothetical protein [Tichowtungia aerotolerans]QHI68762.1 hypothetical protein GT409_04630 [Tichowtungia aerotolerans]